MHTIVEIVKNLLVIIILASFLELLLPSGAMKPYVRLAIGLFVLIAVLNPALRLLLPENALHISSWEISHYAQGPDEVLKRGDELQQQIIAAGNHSLKSKLEGQINAIAMLVPGIDTVDSTVRLDEYGSIEKVTLQVFCQGESGDDDLFANILNGDRKPPPDAGSRLVEIMTNMFGLSRQQIEIQMQGGT